MYTVNERPILEVELSADSRTYLKNIDLIIKEACVNRYFAYFCKIRPISAIGIDIILKDAILQLEAHQSKRPVSQKKR